MLSLGQVFSEKPHMKSIHSLDSCLNESKYLFSRKRRRTATRKCWTAVIVNISPLTTSGQNGPVSCWLATLLKTQVRNWFNTKLCIFILTCFSHAAAMIINVDNSNHFLTVNYSSSVGNGPVHQTSGVPPLNVESLIPRPFRLESLGVPPAHGKVKRKKSKTLITNEGNWQDTALKSIVCEPRTLSFKATFICF